MSFVIQWYLYVPTKTYVNKSVCVMGHIVGLQSMWVATDDDVDRWTESVNNSQSSEKCRDVQ